MSDFSKWLETQPESFREDVTNNKLLGNGEFTVEDLAELDNKYNPEDI